VEADPRAERDALLLTLERDRRPQVRAEAAEALCELAFEVPLADRPDFVPAVARLLGDAQAEVRCAGLALAGELLPAPEAREVLTRHVHEATVRVRLEAVGRLADLALPEARGALAAALEDGEAAVRFEAARGMVALRHSAGLAVLLEALDDTELRYRAAAALAKLQDPAALPRLKAVFRKWWLPAFERTQLAGALAVLHDADGVAHLFKRAGTRWSMDRAMAVELLGEVKAPGARERLQEVLADAGDPARGAAARGLGRLGDVAAEGALLRVLDERPGDDDVLLDVAEGLLALGTPGARTRVEALRLTEAAAQAELRALLAETRGVAR
jgi:HEAT repeat protein